MSAPSAEGWVIELQTRLSVAEAEVERLRKKNERQKVVVEDARTVAEWSWPAEIAHQEFYVEADQDLAALRESLAALGETEAE